MVVELLNRPEEYWPCIDDADAPLVQGITWTLCGVPGQTPIKAWTLDGSVVRYLDQVIMGTHHSTHTIVHKDGDLLNCCRDNLEVKEGGVTFTPRHELSRGMRVLGG